VSNNSSQHAPAPGEGPSWGPSFPLLVVAVLLVGGSLGYLAHLWASPSAPPPRRVAIAATSPPVARVEEARAPAAPATALPDAQRPPPVAAGPAPAPPPAPRIQRQRDPDGDQTPDLADHVNEGAIPSMAEVISRLRGAGVTSGLGAFLPPGTRPPLMGLAVPEGFELPPGYVRHYQATDDGQRIEPILMFAPDRPFLDAAGQPVVIPADRVVPPELAPPGMSIRPIVIPAPTGGPGR
jgi:hypothetical protein